MFYIPDRCNVCSDGVIGMHRCDDNATIVFVCTTCDATWDTPNIKQLQPLEYFDEGNLLLYGHNCSLTGPNSGWATLKDIINAELENYIDGEGDAW